MYVWDDKKKQYVSDTPASRIPVKDSAELFDSNNVEGALAELAGERDAQGITLQDHTGKIENLTEAVDWLKVNGGGGGGTGGGGTVMPTISTTDELSQVVPKGQEIVLNVFFSSPNLGSGSLVLLVNNKEVNSFTIKQGSNTINIGKLTDLRNKVVIYAKDRANLVSNEITYNIINGGVSLTLDFDYYADYPADKDVLMRYTIDTDQEDVQLEVTVDNNKSSVACKNGYNEYHFKNLTVGIHAVTVRAVSGQFISETYNFNLVIINSDSLYISSTFGENPKCTLGVPVVIDYRISYKDDTAVTLVLTLDGEVNKTLTSKRGSYAWTLNDMTLGSHSYKIDCTLGADTVSLEGTFVVEAGDYTPLQINTDGLRYQMGCANRTNQDDDKEEFIYDNGTSQITTRLKGFNFETNGWIDGALVCNGGAYAEIDYACMAENAPYSLTVEIDFKATDIGIHDARVLECRDADTKKGFHVALTEAKLNSISQEAKVYITPEERTTVSLQIDRQNKFAKIYVNGIITSAFKLTDSGSGTSTVLESFAHNGKIYVGCDKNLDNIGNCTIYDIRVYERRVSNDEIVKNVIAQEKDLRKQEDLYNFCFNNNTLSTMRLYSDEVENKVSNMTNTNKITMRAVYRSTNTEKYGQPFELKYCKVYWQGTSSLDYIRKNYNLELYDDDLKEFYYSPYPNAVQEYLFCLKCDYMESSHARNVGIGNLINKYWYTSKNPAQLKNDMVQNAVQGFPMLLYINDEFMGVYNFNTDRYSNASFGYTGDNCLAYELSANSDTTAGAFITYDKTKHEGNEIDYYKRDFMCLYPPTRRAGNDTMDEIIDLVKFVDKSSDEEFVTNINNNVYFNKEYLLRYLIYCLVMGAVDSLGKNMKLATWDNGTTWYPQIYDCDTTMGLDNSGMLYYTDSSMKIQAGTYNTSSSRLWSRLIELMWADIQAEYVKMRNTYLTLDNLYSCIIDNQMDLIPATYYNSDCETKYLQFGALYLDVLHGQGKQQVMEWLRARLLFLDTYMEYWTTTSEFISLRAGKDGLAYIDLEMFDNMYAQIKWRNTGKDDDALAIQIKEVKKNAVTRFEFNVQASTDQEIRIFGAKYVKSLGDLSNLELVKIDVSNATRLTKMECHSEKLKNVILSTCTNLQYVDLKDCSTLGSTEQSTKNLDVSRCSNLKYVNCQNTQLQGINLNPKGSNIREAWFPKSIQTVVFTNCPQLETVGLEYEHGCKELRLINCPNVKRFGEHDVHEKLGLPRYPDAYYLQGCTSIYLDNSYNVEWFEMLSNIGITDITFRNLSKLKGIKLGARRIATEGTYPTQQVVQNSGNFKIETLNCPNLETLLVVDPERLDSVQGYKGSGHIYYTPGCGIHMNDSKSEYYHYDIGVFLRYPGYVSNGKADYSGFDCNTLDLSKAHLKKVVLGMTCNINKVILPKTIKDFEYNSWHEYISQNDVTKAIPYNKSAIYEGTEYGLHNGWNHSLASGGKIYSLGFEDSEFSDLVWDFGNIELDNLTLLRVNEAINGSVIDISYKIDIKNLNLKAKKVTPCLKDKWVKSIQGNIDLSNFTGESLQCALQGITENVNVTLPNEQVYANVKYWEYFLHNANTTQITWQDVEKMFPHVNDVNRLFYDTILKPQTGEGDAIDLINTIDASKMYYSNGGNLGGFSSNLQYIKTLNIYNIANNNGFTICGGSTSKPCTFPTKIQELILGNPTLSQIGNLFYNNSQIQEIGKLDVMGCVTGADHKSSNLWFTFYSTPNLQKMGDITIHGDSGRVYNFGFSSNSCPSEIGNMNFKALGNLGLSYGDAGTHYRTMKIGKLPDLTECGSLNSTFTGMDIETLDLSDLEKNTVISSMQRTFKNSNIGTIIGLDKIPNSVTEGNSMFQGANVGSQLPTFNKSSLCTNVEYMFSGYQGNNVPNTLVLPPNVTKTSQLCSWCKNLPTPFVLDMSMCSDILSSSSLFTNTNAKDVTIKLPKYLWDGKVGTVGYPVLASLLSNTTPTNLSLDFTAFQGTYLGMGDAVYGSRGTMTFNGIAPDYWYKGAIGWRDIVFSDFSIYKKANGDKAITLGSALKTLDLYKRFINEALETLDCAEVLYSNIEKGGLVDETGTEVHADNYRTAEMIPVVGGSTYIVQIPSQGNYARFLEYDSSGTVINNFVVNANNLQQGSSVKMKDNTVGIKICRLSSASLVIHITNSTPTHTPQTLKVTPWVDKAYSTLSDTEKEELETLALSKGWNLTFGS